MIRGALYKFLQWVGSYNNDREAKIYANSNKINAGTVHEKADADIDGMRFTIMSARGGTIIQMRSYDARRDVAKLTTYVVPEGEDIASEVGKIVSMEMLTQ